MPKMATPEHFDWAAYTEAVAANIFGACNEEMSRAPEDVRFGNHGSVSVNYMTGQWYDHENERGGGIKELIRVYKQIDDRDAAIAYAEQCQQNFRERREAAPERQRVGKQSAASTRSGSNLLLPRCFGPNSLPSRTRRLQTAWRGLRHRHARQAHENFPPAPPLGRARPKLAVGPRGRRIYAPGAGEELGLFRRRQVWPIPHHARAEGFQHRCAGDPLSAPGPTEGSRRRPNDLHRRGREESRPDPRPGLRRNLLRRRRQEMETGTRRLPAGCRYYPAAR